MHKIYLILEALNYMYYNSSTICKLDFTHSCLLLPICIDTSHAIYRSQRNFRPAAPDIIHQCSKPQISTYLTFKPKWAAENQNTMFSTRAFQSHLMLVSCKRNELLRVTLVATLLVTHTICGSLIEEESTACDVSFTTTSGGLLLRPETRQC